MLTPEKCTFEGGKPMKNNYALNNLRISPVAYGLYLLVAILIGICIDHNNSSILHICGDRPRYMQFAWIVGLSGITLWKSLGYYVLRNTRMPMQFFCNLLIDVILFVPQYSILSKLGLPISLSMVTLVFLGSVAAIQSNNNMKKLHRVAILVAYIIVGDIYVLINGNGIIWKNDYSVFSHIFMLVACLVIFYVLSGMFLKIGPAFIKDLWEYLTLDD